MSAPFLQLKPNVKARAIGGHPWVFANEVAALLPADCDGGVVELRDRTGRGLGTGIYNGRSQIVWRRLSRQRVALDEAFLRGALARALARRGPEAGPVPVRRLVWSEADELPGVVLDQFGDTLVLQIQTLAMEQRSALLGELLAELVRPAEIIFRNDAPIRRLEGLPIENHTRSGRRLGAAVAEHRRVRVLARPGPGAEDGILPRPAPAARGGGGPGAGPRGGGPAPAGARRFLQPGALRPPRRARGRRRGARARQRRGRGRGGPRQCGAQRRPGGVRRGQCLRLAQRAGARERAGLGPDRARSAAVREVHAGRWKGALRGYKDINLRAMQRLAPGGILATYTCSHHMQDADLRGVLAAAAADAKRRAHVVAWCHQPADHPVLVTMPESEYLRGYILRVE